ncbi:MAG: hypothetical protein ACLVBP_13400 [Ruminococcus sp.]
MSEAQSAASELQKQQDDITAYIDSFGDLQETYAHYTYRGLNADELSYLNRPEVLQLMKNVIFPEGDGKQLERKRESADSSGDRREPVRH